MSEEQKAKEDEVFDQELSLDDLDAAAGGSGDCNEPSVCGQPSYDSCTRNHYRQIYGGGGFPNCAATVEDGSWCGENDACNECAIEYKGFRSSSCEKAWE